MRLYRRDEYEKASKLYMGDPCSPLYRLIGGERQLAEGCERQNKEHDAGRNIY